MQAACEAMGAKHGRLKMNPELLRELLVGYLLLQSNSLRRGRNQIPVSNVYELAPISCQTGSILVLYNLKLHLVIIFYFVLYVV